MGGTHILQHFGRHLSLRPATPFIRSLFDFSSLQKMESTHG
jgi:hypothetical protein